MSNGINFICCNPDLVGGITGGIIIYPYFYTPRFLRKPLQCLQMFRSEKLSHQKIAKYADEKGMYLEVTPSGGMHWWMKFRFNGKRWNQSQ